MKPPFLEFFIPGFLASKLTFSSEQRPAQDEQRDVEVNQQAGDIDQRRDEGRGGGCRIESETAQEKREASPRLNVPQVTTPTSAMPTVVATSQ